MSKSIILIFVPTEIWRDSSCPVRVQRVKGLMLVTYNGADMSKFAPPHSYINAMDFKSVSALAKYMIQVIILK